MKSLLDKFFCPFLALEAVSDSFCIRVHAVLGSLWEIMLPVFTECLLYEALCFVLYT